MKKRDEIKKKLKSMSEDELVDLFINKENELNQKNGKLNEKTTELNKKTIELNEKMTELNEKTTELNWYKEQLALLNKLRFSSKSEKIISGQLNLFNEVEDVYDMPAIEETPIHRGKKKKTREANYSALPTKTIHHELEDKNCPICGTQMRELAPQVIDVLKYQPARYTMERHIVHQYICPACTDENLEAEIFSAEGAPKRLIKGSVVSSSVVAGIAFNKYVSGTPLYRQEQELKRKKVEISRANMSNWLMKCGKLLQPIYEQMNEDMKELSHIHMDETTTIVLEDRNERSKSYMWLVVSGKHEMKQMAIYRYHENREHAFAKEMIGEDYRGSIHCDGYEAYHKFEYAKILGCMAHARRYFIEALEISPHHNKAKKLKGEQLKEYCEKNPSYGNIVHVVGLMKRLFVFEQRYQEENLIPEEIEKRRQEEQKPILDELFECLNKYQDEYSAKSKMGSAITYALNQKQYLENYLRDGEAEISNNRGERLIKPFVMGRKAWLFSNTKSGAEMSAIYYSLIESAKLNHLDIQDYLEYVLNQIAEHGEDIDYRVLTPYAKELPITIKVKN